MANKTILGKSSIVSVGDPVFLLKEDGFYLLKEDGDKILLEQVSNTRTILGKAAILRTTSQTILGKARIGLVTSQTILGQSRITIITQKAIQGLSRIEPVINKVERLRPSLVREYSSIKRLLTNYVS